jgi:hypothetical protein
VWISLYFGTTEGGPFIAYNPPFFSDFGTTGEGGSFALFQALYPPDKQNVDEDRALTGELENHFGKSRKPAKTFKDKARWPLLLWVSNE